MKDVRNKGKASCTDSREGRAKAGWNGRREAAGDEKPADGLNAVFIASGNSKDRLQSINPVAG